MATITVGGALNFDQHNQTVEAALDADDFTPLVQLFPQNAKSASPNTTSRVNQTDALSAGAAGV